jgi:hypothetical protein
MMEGLGGGPMPNQQPIVQEKIVYVDKPVDREVAGQGPMDQNFFTPGTEENKEVSETASSSKMNSSNQE